MPSKGLPPPPANYQCPYHTCCPHLQGLSTEFVFAEYQNFHWEHLDHWKARDELNELLEQMRGYTQELEAQNAELKAKLTALHRGFLGTSYNPPVKPILLLHDYEGLRISPIFGNTPPACFQIFSSADSLALPMSPRLIVTIIRHLHALSARIAHHPLGDFGDVVDY